MVTSFFTPVYWASLCKNIVNMADILRGTLFYMDLWHLVTCSSSSGASLCALEPNQSALQTADQAMRGAFLASRARRFFTGGSGRGEVRENTPGNYSQVFVVRWNFRNSLNRLRYMIINCHMMSASVVS